MCVSTRAMVVFVSLFFKQKTAYEMRISDWSSDVCSSDLQHRLHAARSNAFDRLVNGETDEEIRAALANFEPSRSGLILALAGWQEETRPVCDLDDESQIGRAHV